MSGSEPGRDRYLDLLRSIALVRVVAYHTFAGAVFSLVFPAMGVMFALAGFLMARSLRRPAGTVLVSRARRVLVPLWVYAATVLALLVGQGWSPGADASWGQVLLWCLPVGDPVLPESAGSGAVDPTWPVQAGEILWYVRTYFWFLLLSPVLLRAFRARPWPVLLAPLALSGLLALGLVPLPSWADAPVTDLATYGSCWILGFAHQSGMLRRIPRGAVLAAGPAVMGLGLCWAAGHRGEAGWDLNEIPFAQALWSFGFCAVLLRVSPAWRDLPRPLRFLDGAVTLLNSRAMTVYLWHNLLLVGTVLLVDVLWESDVLATAVPGLLASPWLSFLLVWPLLAVVVLAVGWAEDLAAGRRPRLWPVRPAATPATAPMPAPVPGPAAATAAGQGTAGQGAAGTGFPGRSWLYPRSVREPAALSPRSPRGGPG
ncbi:acyltransferase [Kocuria sp. WN036]|uniref:acyltransferase family protein n=1 Tax=unclassified Kocuria TaxID=2649579 RepID=UPI000BAB5306|nr:acyltransferase [Kocuria sp. WN036]MCC5783434.1 acyltransferase [Kocuria sp. CCUG 69068]PAU91498.1 acyltransferase [Kocuria sp. WN036]